MVFALILGFILGAVTIIFALQNTEIVELSFFSWQFASPLALVIILATSIGGLLGILAAVPGSIQKSFIIRRLNKDNQRLWNEAEASRQATAVAETPVIVDVHN